MKARNLVLFLLLVAVVVMVAANLNSPRNNGTAVEEPTENGTMPPISLGVNHEGPAVIPLYVSGQNGTSDMAVTGGTLSTATWNGETYFVVSVPETPQLVTVSWPSTQTEISFKAVPGRSAQERRHMPENGKSLTKEPLVPISPLGYPNEGGVMAGYLPPPPGKYWVLAGNTLETESAP